MTVEQVGSPALLADSPVPVEGALAESIVSSLGVPDEIQRTDQGYRFVYRFARREQDRLGIASYGVKLLTGQRDVHRKGKLDLWFDSAGHLFSSKLSEGGDEGEREAGHSMFEK